MRSNVEDVRTGIVRRRGGIRYWYQVSGASGKVKEGEEDVRGSQRDDDDDDDEGADAGLCMRREDHDGSRDCPAR
jgi:hypothetical protein